MANIYEKILEVMKSIEYLSKDDHVKFNNTNYKAMSEEKVTTTVRKELIKQGLVVFPVEQTVVKEGNITTTNTTYKMVNTENPEEFVFLASSGQGSDTQDKGVGKAMTYSFKYMLLRTFAIPTGEDPDKVASDQISDEEDIAYIKSKLEDSEIEVEKFLFSMSSKFGRKVKSVDDMKEKSYKDKQGKEHRELSYAKMRLDEKLREENK
jgi:hypothetical protein